MKAEVAILPDAAQAASEAARRLAAAAEAAVAARGEAHLALSGGRSPGPVFDALARRPGLPWARVHLHWADERCVPPGHAESNYRLARERLLSKVPVAPERVHRLRGELEPAAAAAEASRELRRALGPRGRLDAVLLGLGEDGHTASLFPGTAALAERRRPVCANRVPALAAWRLTMTFPALNAVREVLVLACGKAKARVLARALHGPPGVYPIQSLRPTSGRLAFLLDREAAKFLQ
ncbi:MAG: 6-phosphogluconolactonase [Elusimicrobia bacterium]|nr:6-phosphogluconolactonase [Elusimicrobiota bacterium]